MTPRPEALTNEAVTPMKQGRPPEMVYSHLLSRGLDGFQARSLVDQLVAFKRQAEAMDPARLREDAKWMLSQGATVEHVVQHFVAAGVSREHATPEVERIASKVREMRPCDRCRSPAAPAELYFDSTGSRICRRCRSLDDIGNADRRAIQSAMEKAAPGLASLALAMGTNQDQRFLTLVPFCSRCRVSSGIHVNALQPAARAQIHPGWQYVCRQCMHGIC
jgi:hypothetical protein